MLWEAYDFQLTEDERSLVNYADSMAEWLEPYHNYTRPPPHVVLAEASKQTELKTGHPLKGVEIQPPDGASNGNGRKNEEPPMIRDTPALVANYFKGLCYGPDPWNTHWFQRHEGQNS